MSTSGDSENRGNDPGRMKQLETLIERTILASRWILVVFYIVLAAAPGLYALAFVS